MYIYRLDFFVQYLFRQFSCLHADDKFVLDVPWLETMWMIKTVAMKLLLQIIIKPKNQRNVNLIFGFKQFVLKLKLGCSSSLARRISITVVVGAI